MLSPLPPIELRLSAAPSGLIPLADDQAEPLPEVLELPEHDGSWGDDLTLVSFNTTLEQLETNLDPSTPILEAGPASYEPGDEYGGDPSYDPSDDPEDAYQGYVVLPSEEQGPEQGAFRLADALDEDEHAYGLVLPPEKGDASRAAGGGEGASGADVGDGRPAPSEISLSGIAIARRSIMDLLASLWDEQNPRFLKQVLWFAARVDESVRPRFLTAVFALVAHHPRATASIIATLSRLEPVLDETGMKQLVRGCARAQERLPFPMRVELLRGLVRAGRLKLAQGLVMHELSRGPAQETAQWLLALSRRLPRSVFKALELDALVTRCLDRLGTHPNLPALEPLLMVVDPRQLKDEALRERFLLTLTRALKPELLHVRHRERLFFLQRLTEQPALRARLRVLHDLAHMSIIGPDVGIPQLVLGMLPHFPEVLDGLPEEEVGLVVRFILRRLFRRLTEQDHELIVERLCSLKRPQPFIQAYFGHMESMARKVSGSAQLELWSEVFQAWLPRHMSQYREHAEPQLQAIVRGLDKEVRRELTQTLKRRFGKGQQLLSLEMEEEKQGWLRPWFRGQRQPL